MILICEQMAGLNGPAFFSCLSQTDVAFQIVNYIISKNRIFPRLLSAVPAGNDAGRKKILGSLFADMRDLVELLLVHGHRVFYSDLFNFRQFFFHSDTTLRSDCQR